MQVIKDCTLPEMGEMVKCVLSVISTLRAAYWLSQVWCSNESM